MGFEIGFFPPKEKMESYKPWNENSVDYERMITNYKRELVSFCLKEQTKGTYQIAESITFQLRCLYSAIEMNEKYIAYKRWRDDDEHRLWYCGWQFSHDCDFDKDLIIERTVDDLVILTDVVKTPDYFDDNDKFYRKREEITEQIDGFIESMEDYAIHGIIDDLKEYEEKDEEEKEEVTPIIGGTITTTEGEKIDEKFKIGENTYDAISATDEEALKIYHSLGENDVVSIAHEDKDDKTGLMSDEV